MSQSILNQEANIAKIKKENEEQSTGEKLGKTDDSSDLTNAEVSKSTPSKFNISKINIENEVQLSVSENTGDTFRVALATEERLKSEPSKYAKINVENEGLVTASDNVGRTDDKLKFLPDDEDKLKLQPPRVDGSPVNHILVDNKEKLEKPDVKGDLEGPKVELPPYVSRANSPVRSPLVSALQSQGPSVERYGGLARFYDPRSRNSFVALVMSIVFVMLLATAGFIAIVLVNPTLKIFFQEAGWLTILPAVAGLVIVNYSMMFLQCARRPPLSIIMLSLGTACVGVIAAKVSTHYRTEIIMYAAFATGAVVFVCFLVACSKFDFTSWMIDLDESL
ncbi:unnamed protein product [Chrysodeixis includens]|uniref:Uncharacterized protein n=1 Tax=Chrysodeixis includens TaxID=689277 RepID=A0A9N8KW80_CHRIL|nr:unnamed protein product [Chrysodeixis includens]